MKKILNNELCSHAVVSFGYFFLLSLFRFKFDLSLIWIWLGGIVGTYLLDIDHWLYWFWLHPEADDSQKAKEILLTIKTKNIIGSVRGIIRDWYRLLVDWHSTHTRLVFHSVVFQAVLLVLTVYILSSGGSNFGSGLVLAMNLHLLKDVWQDYFVKGKDGLAEWFLWQVRDLRAEKYLQAYLIISSLIFLILTGWLVV